MCGTHSHLSHASFKRMVLATIISKSIINVHCILTLDVIKNAISVLFVCWFHMAIFIAQVLGQVYIMKSSALL